MEYGEAKALLSSYLNRRMRVAISDGRVIDGRFLCTDSGRNMVLGSCEEFFSEEEIAELEGGVSVGGAKRPSRMLGLAIIPGAHIVSISLATAEEEEGGGATSAVEAAEHCDETTSKSAVDS